MQSTTVEGWASVATAKMEPVEVTVARPRSFDEVSALDAAVACFWDRGYSATSVRDLSAEMGISGPSLYNAFGDKRALFCKALERTA